MTQRANQPEPSRSKSGPVPLSRPASSHMKMSATTARRLWGLLVLGLLWQLGAWWVQSDLLPAPSSVLVELWQLSAQGDLLYHVSVTLLRVLASFILAFGVGVLMGALSLWRYAMLFGRDR